MNIRADVVVAGGGISGLAAAYRAQTSGASVVVVEATGRVGGVMQTANVDGFLVEAGPTSMSATASALSLLGDLGLTNDVIDPPKSASRRYVVRNGRMHALPGSPGSLLSSELLSMRGKLRLLAEPFVSQSKRNERDESVADIVRRRFGQEVLDYVVDPFISGVCAGDPERLSSQHVLRIIADLEREYGSVLKGAIKRARVSKGKRDGHIVSFRRGMQQLPEALHGALERSCLYHARLMSVRVGHDHVELVCDVSGTTQTIVADTFVCALPAYAVGDVQWSDALRAKVEQLSAVKYAPVATVALGVNRDDVQHALDGFGMLIPSAEKRRILGALFNSSMFEGRAPAERVLMTAFVGGARMFTDSVGKSIRPGFTGEFCTRAAIEELTSLVGLNGSPIMTSTSVWQRGIPQLEVGHQQVLAAASAIENQVSRAFFTGSYLSGAAIPDCLAHGLSAGERAATRALHYKRQDPDILARAQGALL